jgi:glycosyltransferase involved in cell wall biosynthesis
VRLLWVVTKPPWPPVDGGRVVVRTTLDALARRGHEIDLVAPYDPRMLDARAATRGLTEVCRPHLVPVRPRGILASLAAAARTRAPLAIVRHAHREVRAAVADLLAVRAIDVVHAEQLHALASTAPARARRVPVVLRCQNVESDLWLGRAALASPAARPLLALEARRLARFEGGAVRRAAAVVALTAPDAGRLAALGGGVPVAHVPAPFPVELDPGAPLPDARPAVVVLGSAGWAPNADGLDWLLGEVWPRVHAALPAAALHVFGAQRAAARRVAGVVRHAAPVESRDAFPAGAVLAVPLRWGSGVRVRILEAWSRGLPVVATPAAAHGLDARDGRELLVARDADGFVAALRTLADDPAARARLTAAGRARLHAAHAPDAVAARLEEVYARARGLAAA